MPLTSEQEDKLTEYLETIEAELGRLNSWEKGFVEDQRKRYTEYGAKLNLSPKQWAVLEKVYDKCIGETRPIQGF